jgi:hypothetical protein
MAGGAEIKNGHRIGQSIWTSGMGIADDYRATTQHGNGGLWLWHSLDGDTPPYPLLYPLRAKP